MDHRELDCGGTIQTARKSGAELNVSCFYKAQCIECENESAMCVTKLNTCIFGCLVE